MKTFNGKNLVTMEDWTDSFDDCCQVGDYVEEKIVTEMINRVSPVCMCSFCIQPGTPYSHREDPNTGRLRPTYSTFSKVADGVYEYRGHCFKGETEDSWSLQTPSPCI